MHLPAIPHPERYAGLYIYDFKTHVSVGFTAAEVRYLRESQHYRDGTAYEIYRVTENGGLELRGALDQRLVAKEALCFLRRDAAEARKDYDKLRRAADDAPLPCAVTAMLARVYAFDPPDTTALVYDASASHVVSGWLREACFAGGDRVVGGIDVHAQLIGDAVQITSCRLASLISYEDRSWEEVRRTVDRPLQR